MSALTASWTPSLIAVKSTHKIAGQDLYAIPTALLCLELAILSAVHLYAFSPKEYRTDIVKLTGWARTRTAFKAIGEAMDPWDLVQAIAKGLKWVAVGRKTRHSYFAQQDAPPTDDASTTTYEELVPQLRRHSLSDMTPQSHVRMFDSEAWSFTEPERGESPAYTHIRAK